MFSSKLFSRLITLKNRKREIQEFENFIKSPYFNSRTDVIDLLLFIKKNWNKADHILKKKLEKKTAFKAVFPNEKKYNNGKLNECMTRLTKLLDKFFMIQEVERSPRNQARLLTDALKDRGIDDYYFKNMTSLTTKLVENEEKNVANDATIYNDLRWLNEHSYYHPNFTKLNKELNNQLGMMVEYLDHNYVIKKLQFACEIYTREKNFGYKPQIHLLDEVMNIAKLYARKNKVIKVYSEIIELFISKDTSKIAGLKQQIYFLVEHTDIACKLDLILMFFNALPKYKNRIKLYFELYEYALNQNILIEHGSIGKQSFQTIIHLGCLLNKGKWVDDFIEKYHQYLKVEKEDLHNIKLLLEAYKNFNLKDYQTAYLSLINLKIKDVAYGLRVHTLRIQTLIEGKKSIKIKFDFDNECRKISDYLSRNIKKGNINETYKKNYNEFARIAKKIYHTEWIKPDKELLLNSLNKNIEIPYRDWLAQQIIRL